MAVRLAATPSMRRAPIASTRACSTASNRARAAWFCGASRRWTASSWQASRSAIESARPRKIAASRALGFRDGSGRRALAPSGPLVSDALSAANETSSSGRRASARVQEAIARLKGSAPVSTLPAGRRLDGAALVFLTSVMASSRWRGDDAPLAQRDIQRALRQFLPEAALIEFRDQRALQLVAFVQERQAEGETDVLEYFRVLRPGDHRARAHHGREIAVDEGVARQIGDPHHAVDDIAAVLPRPMGRRLGEDDVDLLVMRQIIQGRDDRPAVHLALIDLLRAMIEAGGVAEADRFGCGEEAERRMGTNNTALIEQRQTARDFEHALNDEHHVGPAGVIFIEAQSDVVLDRQGQDAVAKFGDLLAVLQDNGVLADEVDARDMAVEIDADERPIEPRGHLLDMGRFAGAVVAGDHHPPVAREAGEDRQSRLAVEQIVGIEIGHMLVRRGIGRRLYIGIDAEQLSDRHMDIGDARNGFGVNGLRHKTFINPSFPRL